MSARRRWTPATVVCVLAVLALFCNSCHAYDAGGNTVAIDVKPKEEVCQSIDIRNSVTNFNKLENCTVIEGFLQVQLIDQAEAHQYDNLSFPKLREITGYFLFFRVKGLKSFRTLFPNLAVIRGSRIFHNYALVIYEMFDMEEIGLRALTDIMRGGVRIEKNPRLCYVHSVDWDHITSVATENNYFRDNNEKSNECPNTCPADCPTLPGKGPLCWSQKDCQKKCHKSCGGSTCTSDKTDCCHPSCVGGCWNKSFAACFACRRYLFEKKCNDSCPRHTFLYFDRRCLSKQECKSIVEYNTDLKTNTTYKPFQGRCERECPSGYHTDPEDDSSCVKCENECPKECPAGSIMNIADAQKLKGCTIIKGNLEIHLSGTHDVVIELQENLNTITEIQGQLKVIRSFPITSLNFLSSLRKIGDKNKPQNYALYVLDNQNIAELWNWETREHGLEITGGKLFFHFNPKLCVNKIRDLENITSLNVSDTRDVSLASNGDRTACKLPNLVLDVTEIHPESVVIRFTNFLHLMGQKFNARSLLGYLINYKEAGSGNISMFDDTDACASELETWKVKDESASIDHRISMINYNITNLKPFTRYAVYVKTYMVASEFGGSSDIQYFSTAPTVPTPPVNLRTYGDVSGALHVSWEPPKKPNGNISCYVVVGEMEEYNENFVYSVDYCGVGNKLADEHPPTHDAPKNGSYFGMSAANVTNGNESCCACPKDKYEAAMKEKEIQDSIQFENFLHNNVFVKRNLRKFSRILTEYNQSSRRKKRGITNFFREFSLSNTIGRLLSPGSDGTSNSLDPKSPRKRSFAHVTNTNSLKIKLVKHYTSYIIKVRACHGVTECKMDENVAVEDFISDLTCSQESIEAAQTVAAPAADNIRAATINATISTKSAGSVFVNWEAPLNPNGLILKFDVETRRVDGNHNPTVSCVTYKEYLNLSGIQLASLSAGNYSLRVSATTLWQSGEWSEPRYFYISAPPSSLTPAIIGGIVVAVLVFVVAIMLGAVVYVKKRELQLPDAINASINPDYLPSDKLYVVDEWEVPREKITLLRELGQGSFGMVFEGEAKDVVEDKPVVRCAVKTVNATATMQQRIEFLNEASVMKLINCHHVVRLLGVVSKGQPTYVVMELMFHGDLKTYLRLHRPDEYPGKSPPSTKRILQMAIEIADGMAYLVDNKFIHRDLAARNCMVAEDLTVKIGDFGLTRGVMHKEDYYRKGGKVGGLPIRWMAPESIKDGVFSGQTDVWSFGIVLWEMATLASYPYQGMSNEQVMVFVSEGGTLKKPEHCLDILSEMMEECFNRSPKNRPTFVQLVERLLPFASARFSEVSFYQKHGPFRNDSEQEDAEYVTPSTALCYQHQNSGEDYTTLAVGYTSGVDEEGPKVEVGPRKQRSQPKRQYRVVRMGPNDEDSDGIGNGMLANGRPGERQMGSEADY